MVVDEPNSGTAQDGCKAEHCSGIFTPPPTPTMYDYGQRLEGEEIRLLKVVHPQSPTTICCETKTVSLTDKPLFCALSYAWGDKQNVKSITCNGFQVDVTANLHTALECLHKQAMLSSYCLYDSAESEILCRQGWWWIDALCINQNNVEERNHQVSRMPEIYSGADTVLIWLGDVDGEMSRSLEIIARSKIPRLRSKQRRPSELGLKLKNSLQTVLKQSWFSRMWTLQEAVLAKRAVLCSGPQILTWYHLKRLMARSRFQTGSAEANEAFRSLHEVEEAFKGKKLTLSHLLQFTSYRQALDPRDKIFALLGLLPDHGLSSSLKSDYNISIATLCIRTARWCIEHEKGFPVLDISGLRNHEGIDLPSWAFDYRFIKNQVARQVTYLPETPPNLQKQDNQACSDTHRIISGPVLCIGPVLNDVELQIRGIILAIVESGSWQNLTAL